MTGYAVATITGEAPYCIVEGIRLFATREEAQTFADSIGAIAEGATTMAGSKTKPEFAVQVYDRTYAVVYAVRSGEVCFAGTPAACRAKCAALNR